MLSDLKSSEPKFREKRKAEIEREAQLTLFDQVNQYDMNEEHNFKYDYIIPDDFDFDSNFQQQQIASKPNKPLIRISITGHVRTIEEVKGKGTQSAPIIVNLNSDLNLSFKIALI